jgi:hypothetical protein
MPPIDRSAEAAQALKEEYDSFLKLRRENLTTYKVQNFSQNVARLLLQYQQHISIAKSYFQNESRIVYKLLFAAIIYIADGNDHDALRYLRDNNTTPQEFAELDGAREIARTPYDRISCLIGQEDNYFQGMADRFLQGI